MSDPLDSPAARAYTDSLRRHTVNQLQRFADGGVNDDNDELTSGLLGGDNAGTPYALYEGENEPQDVSDLLGPYRSTGVATPTQIASARRQMRQPSAQRPGGPATRPTPTPLANNMIQLGNIYPRLPPRIVLNPNRIAAEQGTGLFGAQPYIPNQPLEQPLPEPTPEPPAPPSNLGKNLSLGFQQSAVNAAHTLFGPSEAYGRNRIAGGQRLSDAMISGLGIDQQQLADELKARAGFTNRAEQFIGSLPLEAVRYGVGTAAGTAATGNPFTGAVLGSATMDALKAAGEGKTPQEAAIEAGTSGAMAGALEGAGTVAAPYVKRFVGPAVERAISLIPSQEELQAAGEAARYRTFNRMATQTPSLLGDPGALRDLAISTGAKLGSGMYTVGEAAAARARQVKDWISNQQTTYLTPSEQELFQQARQASPEINQAAPYLLPSEARKVIASPGNIESFSRLMQALPQDHQIAAAAKMGIPKLGWYSGSAQAIHDIFGADGTRFAQLLAAMSPRTSVESNLFNALNVWKNWIAEGRPTDGAAIKSIMARSVQGGTEKSALHAWVPNTISALSAEDPMTVTLSGPKVDSFYHDLRNDVFKLAQDAWMANTYGIDQSYLGGAGANVLAGNPGMTPEYAAANARLRSASLSTGMLPTQGQETTWSTGMQLYELAKKLKMDPRDVLQKGLLTPEIIAGAPDFSQLFREPRYGDILTAAGYEPQLSALQQAPPVRIASTPQQLARGAGRILPPQTGVRLTPTEQQGMMEMAGRLADTRAMRARVTRAAQFPVNLPEEAPTAPGNLQMEWYPGVHTGIYREIQPPNPRLPWSSAKTTTSQFLGPYENVRGQNALLTATGLETIPAERVIGAFTPQSGLGGITPPAETNPGVSYGFTAPLVRTPEGNWAVDPQTMARMRGVGALQGYTLGQEAVGIPVMVRNPQGEDYSMLLPKKSATVPATSEQEVRAIQQAYPGKAFVHTGPRLHVLNIDNVPMDDAMLKNMRGMMRATEGDRVTNIGTYMDNADAWAQKPGSGAATGRLFDELDQMSPQDLAAVDQHIRYETGKTLAAYRQKVRTQKWTLGRPDFENALDILANQGIAGLRQGLKSGAFLPGLAGALTLPYLLSDRGKGAQSPAAP